MNNLKELKEKSLRIYGAICDDFDAGHYSSCVNLIKKNRELLSSGLSPIQDEKIYKIYAFSVFTMIEDLYLAGNVADATEMQNSYEQLLYNHLPSNVQKSLEAYKTGDIPEIDNGATEKTRLNIEDDKEKLKHYTSSWTMANSDFESILKKKSTKQPHKKSIIISSILVLVLICGLGLYYSDLFNINKLLGDETDNLNTETPIIVDSTDDGLEILESPEPPPVEKDEKNIEYVVDPNSSISPNVIIDENGYVLPTDSRLITNEDLAGFDQKMIRLATNEMFARKGFAFNSTGDYYNFFCQFSWYNPDPDISVDQSEALFSEIEKANLLVLLNYIP